jgi:tetratricopeptide (TPR) repeat protein
MKGYRSVLAAVLCLSVIATPSTGQESRLGAARQAYDKGDYRTAIEILKAASTAEPSNGEIFLLLTKSYLETKQYDDAVNSAEKAVSSDPQSSVYHQWLGAAYGQKADHASMLSAYPLARKTQKEFETAVQLDERNFDAAQSLIEYDCTAPSIVGGGEDKAQPLIQKLMGVDPAEGHYGAGLCKAVKKDFPAADLEYTKALESKPKTVGRIYDIGDYFLERGQGDKLLLVAAQGQALGPNDPRGKYYRAVGWILERESHAEAEKLLEEYLGEAPRRSNYPEPWDAHYWLGRLYESERDLAKAKTEYQEALKLNPKFKKAQEALKHVGSS